jgi:hypothetical protein
METTNLILQAAVQQIKDHPENLKYQHDFFRVAAASLDPRSSLESSSEPSTTVSSRPEPQYLTQGLEIVDTEAGSSTLEEQISEIFDSLEDGDESTHSASNHSLTIADDEKAWEEKYGIDVTETIETYSELLSLQQSVIPIAANALTDVTTETTETWWNLAIKWAAPIIVGQASPVAAIFSRFYGW